MPKTRIAITYNEKTGGYSVLSLKDTIKELDSEVADADYRLIMPDLPDLEDIYTNKEKRSTLFKQAKRKAILFLNDIEGLILSGTLAMVDPRLYVENLDKQTIDLARNIAEAALIHVAIQKGIPLLGICGGLQIINVYFGGSLKTLSADSMSKQKFMDYSAVQVDVLSELGQILSQGSIISQNEESTIIENFFGAHNQAIKNLGGKGLINDGGDDYLKCSAIATDDEGSVEAIESTYGSPLMGVQFHPEVGVKGFPNKVFIFQAPTESEVLKNKKILEAFTQAAETYRHKKMLVQQIPLAAFNAILYKKNLSKKSESLTAKNKAKKCLKKQKNAFFRIIICLYKMLGKLIRKIISYKLTHKKSQLRREKELKKSSSLLSSERDKREIFFLKQDFLNTATKESGSSNLQKTGLEIKLSKKHHHDKFKKRSYSQNSFFKKTRKTYSTVLNLKSKFHNNRLSLNKYSSRCFTYI